MIVITLVTQKGGAGKTTLAVNLAVSGAMKKPGTLIIDLDPQESASKWWQRRDIDEPGLVKLKPPELPEALRLAKSNGTGRVFIDTAGHDSLVNNQAVMAADFCLVPCQPSVIDIEAVYPTVEALKRLEKPFAFVLTRCPAVGQDEKSARAGLSGLGLVAKPFTGERKAYKSALALGEGVVEYDERDKAAAEIKALERWINQKMRKVL